MQQNEKEITSNLNELAAARQEEILRRLLTQDFLPAGIGVDPTAPAGTWGSNALLRDECELHEALQLRVLSVSNSHKGTEVWQELVRTGITNLQPVAAHEEIGANDRPIVDHTKAGVASPRRAKRPRALGRMFVVTAVMHESAQGCAWLDVTGVAVDFMTQLLRTHQATLDSLRTYAELGAFVLAQHGAAAPLHARLPVTACGGFSPELKALGAALERKLVVCTFQALEFKPEKPLNVTRAAKQFKEFKRPTRNEVLRALKVLAMYIVPTQHTSLGRETHDGILTMLQTVGPAVAKHVTNAANRGILANVAHARQIQPVGDVGPLIQQMMMETTRPAPGALGVPVRCKHPELREWLEAHPEPEIHRMALQYMELEEDLGRALHAAGKWLHASGLAVAPYEHAVAIQRSVQAVRALAHGRLGVATLFLAHLEALDFTPDFGVASFQLLDAAGFHADAVAVLCPRPSLLATLRIEDCLPCMDTGAPSPEQRETVLVQQARQREEALARRREEVKRKREADELERIAGVIPKRQTRTAAEAPN